MRNVPLGSLVVLILVSISCSGTNCGIPKPIIVRNYPLHELVQMKDLNEDVQEYFTEMYPNSHPACIGEDFDGDGVTDYALLLRTKVGGKVIERLVVLKGEPDGQFIPVNLCEFGTRTGDYFLRYMKPGKIKHWAEGEEATIDRPGFELVLFESASYAYFWKNGEFHDIQTSD